MPFEIRTSDWMDDCEKFCVGGEYLGICGGK